MKTLLLTIFSVLCIQTVLGADTNEHTKIVCYWNSTAYDRQGEFFSLIAPITHVPF